jgi:hypothetical protein
MFKVGEYRTPYRQPEFPKLQSIFELQNIKPETLNF